MVLLTVWAWVPPVLASGGGVTVVEDRGEVDFPTELSFTLTAEGDQNIVEVQLLYRAAGSETWSYAYPDFTPGRQVTSKFGLLLTGATYLPPGVLVEYYYIITDAQGNRHHTTPKVLEYLDGRFSWDHTQIDSLVLLHHGQPEAQVESVSRVVGPALARVRDLLQIESAKPIRGVIYLRSADAREVFPRQSQTITDSQVFGGFAFPNRGVFVAIGFNARIITHEASHLLLRQAVGPNGRGVPAWLNEGFASYAEPGSRPFSGLSLSSGGASPKKLSLRAMSSLAGTPTDIGAFYRKAESVVAFMIEEFGEASFRRFVANLAEGRTTDQALLAAYGLDTTELEARWATEDRRPAAPAPRPRSPANPWMNFSTLVLGGLALVVSFAVIFRYLRNKLRPAEERYPPWNPPDFFDPVDEDIGDDNRPR